MATETDAELFIGTDHQFEYTILNAAEDEAVDVAAWAMSWMVKRRMSHADADATVTKTTAAGIAVSGTYDSDPAVNTQVVTVSVADTDTDGLRAGDYYFELKRTDAGFETILAYGGLELLQPVHRA